MLSIRYFQKRIRQICESKICSSILNAKIPLLCFFFSGSWMPGGMECVTQLLLALLLYHLVTDTLWLFLVKDFHMETEGYSPVRGNHSIPPPGSLCNTGHPWDSQLQRIISAPSSSNGTKGKASWWSIMLNVEAPCGSILVSTFFSGSENLRHGDRCWRKKCSLSF